MTATKKTLLTPAIVRRRLRKIDETIVKLREDAKDARFRCSHMDTVSSYHEYEDSGYECSGCGSTWRSCPKNVGKVG